MPKINLALLIEKHVVKKDELAVVLFPDNKHKNLALDRAIKGLTSLSEEQIVRLASFLGISINDLFAGSWQLVKPGKHAYSNGDYFAELDPNTWITKIYHKESLQYEEVISNGAISLSEYFAKLDSIIFKFKTHEPS